MGRILSFRGLGSAFIAFCLCGTVVRAQSKDQLAPTLSSAHRAFSVFAPRGHSPLQDSARAWAIDSIPTFSGEFRASGIGPTGAAQHRWFYTMAGAQPERGGTSTFDAPIIPVSLDLLDYDGSVRVVNGRVLHYSVQPFVSGVVNSPIFQNTEYSSSDVLTQFSDAVQRAEFYLSLIHISEPTRP